ncbi:MAG: sigma-54 dependent transcriptional regulator [Rhodospirillaceae bacterium]|nr:sigma-54 dependent transcriptional regulator [Rhodospirillaceae bacterium]MDE0256493.1 sigma-54 dependent transcriptional regulator [Rhodospirillaceae bacterium]MDE0619703.1 sigma-54 dependent transcriptional regulator [Rhodospirillaceae bacterium]
MAADILIVDDEADIRKLIAGILTDEGYETRLAADADAALDAIRARRPSLILLDIWLEGSKMDGNEILAVVKKDHPDLPVIMISGHGTVEMAVNAIKMGAYDFIEKPFKSDRLLVQIERAVETERLKRENEALLERAGGAFELVGASPAIAHIDQVISRVARTSSRVLVTGAAGVGKEVVARLIHQRSTRSSGPFVIVNCATMRPDRLEQELFGEEAGGHTKTGILERCHGGTLLLDEVADMPWETQGEFVRILQDQGFQRIGGHSIVEVNIRVIASTSRPLEPEIAARRFREDLYYRLRVVPIDIPPLRDRRQDIPDLARHFMAKAAARDGLPARGFSDEALAALQAYNWPGNVRELGNVIHRMLIMAPAGPGEKLTAKMVPPVILGDETMLPRLEKGGEIMALPLREAREMFEREYLTAQVSRFGGNVSRTAEFVGMERSALHRKLKLLGLAGGERSAGDGSDTVH